MLILFLVVIIFIIFVLVLSLPLDVHRSLNIWLNLKEDSEKYEWYTCPIILNSHQTATSKFITIDIVDSRAMEPSAQGFAFAHPILEPQSK